MKRKAFKVVRSSTVGTASSRAFTQICNYWSRGLPWIRKGSLAVIDQGLISGSNFLIGVLLARWLAPEAYGAYGLAFAIFLLLSLVHQALILEPMSVFGPSQYRNCQQDYLGSLLWIEGGLGLMAACILGLAAWVTYQTARSPGLPAALTGMALSAPCLLLFWLTRGAFYVKLAPQTAVTGALLYGAVVVSGLWIVYRQGLVSPFTAFLLMALGAIAVSVLQLFHLRPTLKPRLEVSQQRQFWESRALEINSLGFDKSPKTLFPDEFLDSPGLRAVTHQHWDYGRWALGSSFMVWIPWNIQFILIGSFSSMAGAGELRALLNLAQPVAQGFAAFCLLAQPYAAATYDEEGVAGLGKVTRNITLLFAGTVVAYWVVVCAFRTPIVLFLYHGKYQGVAPLIPWIALASLFRTVAYGPAIALRAMQSPSSVFAAYGASSAIALAVGIPLVRTLGLRGAILSIIVSSAATPFVESALFRRKLRSGSKGS
jgi:O-antigen/teichoic acid export membrane protein